MTTLSGTLVAGPRSGRGSVTFGRVIESLAFEPVSERAPGGPYLLPGYIDVHVHGGGGADTMDGAEAVRALAAFHLRHGTTSLLPTTITNPLDRVLDALAGVAEVVAEQRRGDAESAAPDSGRRRPAAAVLGANLEGPFISPQRLGAQPPFALVPDDEVVARLLEVGVIRLVTLAPEIERAAAVGAAFARAGCRVSVGHTNSRHAEVSELATAVAAAGGVLGFTHLYNAMTQLTGREPGAVGAALADPQAYAEVILDGHHVHRASFLAAAAAKPSRLLLVTDAIRAAGMPEGRSELGGQSVTVSAGAARLDDGTLAGSVLTMDVAVRNAVAAGVDLATASAMASGVPAAYLGLADRGVLEVGRRADLLVLGDDLEVLEVYQAGDRVV